jgi:capsular polysaccharide biosynthesis protein
MDRVAGTRISPALRIAPPNLSGIELLPSVAAIQRKAWQGAVWPPRRIDIFEVDGALVMGRGLTFRGDGTIVTGTSHLLPGEVVKAAMGQFAESWKNAPFVDEDMMLCIRPGHTCYGHVLMELMGAAWVGESVLRDREFSLLVTSPGYLLPIYAQTARAAGLSTRPIRDLLPPVRVRKLYVVNNFAETDVYVSPLIAEYAYTIRRNCDAPEPTGRKLYVARSPKGGRTLANEEEVWQLLEAKGFEKIRAEALKFDEQVRLFAQATHVLGSMGSGLANAMFCSPGARLLTLAPAGMVDTYFYRMAACLGLEYQEQRCADVSSSRWETTNRYLDRDIVVDLALLTKWLET